MTALRTPLSTISLLVAVAFLTLASGCGPDKPIQGISSELSVYDRVLRDSVIRCGYTVYPPGCMLDSAGKPAGVFVETLEEAAKGLGLRVQWEEEVGWATQIEGLEKDRYDMIGSSVWANAKRAKLTTLSVPLYFSPIGVYVRADDNRFDNVSDWSILNDPKFKMSIVDGGTADVIRKGQFPKSTAVSLPENTDFGTSFLDVVNGKADLVLMEPFQASKFIESNGYKLKNVAAARPLHVFGNCYMFKRDQPEFEHMLNTQIEDLINNGFVDALLSKYEKYPGSFLRVQKPYTVQ
jgi:ABC-type amino acid transport substrate-binding protein